MMVKNCRIQHKTTRCQHFVEKISQQSVDKFRIIEYNIQCNEKYYLCVIKYVVEVCLCYYNSILKISNLLEMIQH